jgi:hypothetical protein
MPVGNYELQTAWDPTHSWIWFVTSCGGDCLYIDAIPRPNGGAAPYDGHAYLVNGRYVWAADVPNGLICPAIGLPTHNTYSWDPVTLAGSFVSTFDVGCFGAPGGSNTFDFRLSRY